MATWGIHHTSLVVSDADKALRFYRDGLGLELVGDVEEQTERLAQQVEVPGAWIRCMWLKTPDSNTLLELLEYKNQPGKKFDLCCNDIGAPHVSFLVDDIYEITEKLKSMGYKPTTEPQDVDPNTQPDAKTIYFRDADGIAVEIFQMCPERKMNKRFY